MAFRIPPEATSSQFMEEAQALSIDLHRAAPSRYRAIKAISPRYLLGWLREERSSGESRKDEHASGAQNGSGQESIVDGCVPDTTGRGVTLEMRKNRLTYKGLRMPAVSRLAMAHTARYILDGGSIFKGQSVSAVGGHLFFDDEGLRDCPIADHINFGDVSASAYR